MSTRRVRVIKGFFVFKRYWTLTILFSLVLLSGGALISHGDEVTGVTDRSIKVGLIGDLTGPAADSWIPCGYGIRSFFKMVNDNGGIHGRKIEYILEDDRYSIPLALSCFKKLVYKDKIFTLMGASGGGHSATLIPLAEKEKIPLIAFTSEKRFFYPARKYIFNAIPWYEDQAKLFFEYVFHDLKLKSPTIALMYQDTGSGKATRDAVRELVKVYSVKNYKEVPFPLTTMDFTSEIMRLKQFKPDIIYLHGFVVDTGSIVKTAQRLGLFTPILVTQYGCTDKVLELVSDKATEFMSINPFGRWDEDSPGVREARKAFLAYGVPDVHRGDTNFFQGWLPGMLFYQGFKNAGRDLNTETFLKGIEAIKDFDTQGICGVVTFGPDDHKPIENFRFFKADIGKKRFVSITGWRKPK